MTRWWSNDAAAAGSTIDPTDPIADAGRLHPSRSEYCTMLSQTLKAGRSVLPGATAGDTALRTATAAFIGELQAVAPSGVAAPWRVVGQAVNTLAGGGRTSDINPSAVSAAAATIVTDAKDNCQLDLGPTKG
ncbi:MAG: hypothetical protein J0H43_13455 [Actinobacteria bacterium]|nr:hypothetical protein [Actinomycetota bacterium]